MQDLQLASAEPGGEHLVLVDALGGRYRVAVDEALRTAVRRAHTPTPQPGPDGTVAAPREVQAIIRAGANPQEAAERSGWPVERVLLFSSPILAEREHIALRARATAVRLRGRAGEAPTLEERVVVRLRDRGVDPDTAVWDALRPTGGHQWQVRLGFVAGGRERQATWTYDLGDQILHADDDEARWLSEDEADPATAGGTAMSAGYLSDSALDDTPTRSPRRRGERTTARPDTDRHSDTESDRSSQESEAGPVESTDGGEPSDGQAGAARTERPDLISAMRERSKARGRRGRRRAQADEQTPAPAESSAQTDELPFDDTAETAPPTVTAPGADADPAPVAAAREDEFDVADPTEPETELVEEDEPEDEVPLGWRELTQDVDGDLEDDVTDDADIEDDPSPAVEEAPEEEDVAPGDEPQPEPEAAPEPESDPAPKPARASGGKRKGRTSVPSWDDIMFGGRD